MTAASNKQMEMVSVSAKSVAESKGLSIERRSAARALWEKVICGSMVASKFVSIITTRRQTYAQVDMEGQVFWHIKLMFAAPQFALIPLTLLINVFIIKFYLDDVGVSAAFIAFFQIFSRSFDVLTDPMMAHISDNLTHTRYGRRLPYMMLCPLYAVAFFILVSPPEDTDDAAFWFGGSYLLFYFCDTLVNVPFQALGPELTDDSDARTSLYMYVKVAEGVGVMFGTLMPGVLEDYLPNRQIYQLIAIVFGLFYILTMYTLIKNVKERKASNITDDNEEGLRQPFVTSLYRSMRNSAFKPLVFGWILDFASLAFIATMVPFYVTYYIEVDKMVDPLCSAEEQAAAQCPSVDAECCLSSGKHLGYCMALFFVSGFFAIPIWKYLARHDRVSDEWHQRLKVGKVQAWLAYNVVNVITNVLFVFVPQKGLYYLYFCMIMNGIPTGGQFLISAILADVIDYDEFLNYKRNEGQFTVFASFVPKIIAIPCQSFPLVGMFILGYTNPGTNDDGDLIFQQQNASVRWFIRGLFVFAPLFLVSTSFLVKRLYPIRGYETINVISRGITLHLQGLSAYDPVTKQEVWIEDYSPQEQYLIYLLDQFSHSNLLWLLSPDTIWRRHQEQGIPLRKSTLLHLTGVDDDDDDNNDSTPADNNDNVYVNRGLCSCFDTKPRIKNIIRTRNDVEFGRDEEGNIVYVAVAKFEAHGVSEGVKRIKTRVCLWILLYFAIFATSVIGVATTIQHLENADLAFLPAIFCLMIGLSFVGVGFNYLRFKAANEIKTYIVEKNITDEVLAKCIYPKTKGQHGGALIDDDQELDQINSLLPQTIAHPKQLKSLTNLQLLSYQDEPKQPDLY